MIELCAERGLSLSNTYLEHNSLHKYTKVARSQDGVDVMSMIHLVKKAMLRYVQSVKVVREMGRSFLDHHTVLCKVRLVGAWIKRRGIEYSK